MKIAGYVILVLAVVHLAYAVTTGATQSLSASAWEIFLHLVLHPIAAIALVVMLLKPSTLDRGMTPKRDWPAVGGEHSRRCACVPGGRRR